VAASDRVRTFSCGTCTTGFDPQQTFGILIASPGSCRLDPNHTPIALHPPAYLICGVHCFADALVRVAYAPRPHGFGIVPE